MNNTEQIQYEKLPTIVQTLDEEIEKIRRINNNDMMTLTESEILEIQKQREDDEWRNRIQLFRDRMNSVDSLLNRDISEMSEDEYQEILKSSRDE